jgi:hypothetical protein
MTFILGFVNTELAGHNVDKEFPTMEALLQYIVDKRFEWKSLVIGIRRNIAIESMKAA